MLNQEPTEAGDCVLAWLSDAKAAGLVARWVTDADRVYAAGRSGGSLTALAALRALLSHVTGRSDWIVVRAGSGKPSVRTADGRDGPAVSLSHTAGLVAVAVARDGVVGIDVERHRPRDFAALADQAFGAAERREVAAQEVSHGAPRGATAFYRIWTLREAMAKATGDGLALVMNRTDLADGVVSGRVHVRGQWGLLHRMAEPGYSLGLAWLGGRPGLVPRRVDLR